MTNKMHKGKTKLSLTKKDVYELISYGKPFSFYKETPFVLGDLSLMLNLPEASCHECNAISHDSETRCYIKLTTTDEEYKIDLRVATFCKDCNSISVSGGITCVERSPGLQSRQLSLGDAGYHGVFFLAEGNEKHESIEEHKIDEVGPMLDFQHFGKPVLAWVKSADGSVYVFSKLLPVELTGEAITSGLAVELFEKEQIKDTDIIMLPGIVYSLSEKTAQQSSKVH